MTSSHHNLPASLALDTFKFDSELPSRNKLESLYRTPYVNNTTTLLKEDEKGLDSPS